MDWSKVWNTTRNFLEFIGFLLLGALVLTFLLCVAAGYALLFGLHFLFEKARNWLFPYAAPDEVKEITIKWVVYEWVAEGMTESGFHVEVTGKTARQALVRLGNQVQNLKRDIGLR